ncbi:MAG TPA: HAD family hydrolase [Gaiellaceae bacterium]|nr:HAD family hydrolase [Gaiellaceae bacterium]
MAVAAVVFDVGETLVDETRNWESVADECGVPRFTLMALVGATIGAGESHHRALELLGIRPSRRAFFNDQWYPDAVPCLDRLRRLGIVVGAAGNMAIEHEELIRPHVDFVGSSERFEVEKPAPGFFTRVAELAGVAPERIAYVGDRVDNDVVPALAAGMVAVHMRRGPWGYLHEPPAGAIRISSLDELPAALR